MGSSSPGSLSWIKASKTLDGTGGGGGGSPRVCEVRLCVQAKCRRVRVEARRRNSKL